MTETPLDPAELSAFLDGELPPARLAEIEALLASDPALKAEYETLRGSDATWREAAVGAMFVPAVRVTAAAAAVPALRIAAIVAALLLIRIGGKFVEALGPSLLLNLAALILVGAVVLAAAAGGRDGLRGA
jgi:anti-sigma factor RsiW